MLVPEGKEFIVCSVDLFTAFIITLYHNVAESSDLIGQKVLLHFP